MNFNPRITKAEILEWVGTRVFYGVYRDEGRISRVFLRNGVRLFDIRMSNGVTITNVDETGFDAEGAR